MVKKIKTIRRYNQNYKNFSFSSVAERTEEEYLEFEIKLDDDGNITEESKFAPDGELEEKNSYEFNEKGKLISHTLLYAIDNVTEKRVLTRNNNGNLISEIKYYGDDAGEKTEYEYDSESRVMAVITYDEEGNFISREEIKYDEKGNISDRTTKDSENKMLNKFSFTPPGNNIVEETEHDHEGKLLSKTIITFNEAGKETSTVQTNPQGKLISSVKNNYDDAGNIIEKAFKDFHSKVIRYAYDEKNQLISQELFDESGMLLRKNMYDYDNEGNVIAEQTYEMDTTRGGRDKHFGTRYEYEFDS